MPQFVKAGSFGSTGFLDCRSPDVSERSAAGLDFKPQSQTRGSFPVLSQLNRILGSLFLLGCLFLGPFLSLNTAMTRSGPRVESTTLRDKQGRKA
jgi:hypothetical protein